VVQPLPLARLARRSRLAMTTSTGHSIFRAKIFF
jgi:hypothetical protein